MVSPIQSLISNPRPATGNAAQDISGLMNAVSGFRNTNAQNRQLDMQEQQIEEQKRMEAERREIQQGARDALVALSYSKMEGLSPEEQNKGQLEYLGRRVKELDKQGRDSSDTRNIMALPFDQRQPELLRNGAVLMKHYDGDISETLGLKDTATRPQDLTSSQRDFQEYQRLLEADPQAAEIFGRQAGFLTKEGQKLSSHAEKRLGAANDEAVQSSAAARNYAGLAEDFAKSGAAGGTRAKWSESYKELTGSEDAVSQLRQEYRQIRNTEAVKNLPPGVASDKDIELALSGFPSDTSNAEYIASFMRGMSKLAGHRAGYNEFKSQYISDNGTERGFLSAWKERSEARGENPLEPGNDVNQLSDDELLEF